MTKQDVEAELERQRGLLAALTPEELEAKGAEAEKRIAAMTTTSLWTNCVGGPRPMWTTS